MTKKIVLIILAFAMYMNMVWAQITTSAVPFLLIAPDSRASGMGETGVAIADNVWAVYWNPAGLAFQKGSELGLTHTNWLPGLGLSDLWIAHIAYKQPVEELDGVVSAQLTYLNEGEFVHTGENSSDPLGTFNAYELALAVGYSTKLSNTLGMGINARIIHSYLAPFGTAKEQGRGVATGFSFDLGLLYRPEVFFIPFTNVDLGNRLSLGTSITNIGPKLTYIDKAQADPLPMYLRLGFAYKVLESEFNNMILTMEVSRLLVSRYGETSDEFYKAFFTTWMYRSFDEQIRKFDLSMGLEYWYGSPKLIGLRMGYFYEDPREGNRKFLTFGAGIRYDLYEFDFGYISAFEEQHPLGETLRLTLSIGWGGEGQ
jgi:hypothetical protein